MSQDTWTAVDHYLTDRLITVDPVLDAALRDCDSAGLPPIQVAPNQAKLLQLLALAIGARRILEIGTLGGYSTIWLARALPVGGRLISLEVLPKHAEVAHANLTRAGLDDAVEVRVGRAIDSLQKLAEEDAAPFDLVFIDADTVSTPDYFGWALKLTRPGGLIIVDNVVRKGAVVDAATDDPDAQAVRRLYEVIAAEPRVGATAIQTVGIKGHDGFAIALVLKYHHHPSTR
jgi:predicted O-methyltransferase YrrM